MLSKTKGIRSQSAMEYLMTYGWAILIIAVVLAVLFQLGVFNASEYTGNSCVGVSGYLCSNPILSTNGILSFTFGYQGQQQQITVDGFGCSSNATPPTTFTMVGISTLQSGNQEPISVSCPISANVLGTPFSGYLWVKYDQGSQLGLESVFATVRTAVTTIGAGSAPSITYSYSGYGNTIQTYSLAVTSGYPLYFCEAALGYQNPTLSYTVDYADSSGSEYDTIGHQSSNICTATQSARAGFDIAGIGVSSSTYSELTHGYITTNPQPISYTVTSPDTLVIVMMAGIYNSGATLSGISGCTNVESQTFTYYAYIWVCSNQAVGTYSPSISGTYGTPYAPYVVYGVT